MTDLYSVQEYHVKSVKMDSCPLFEDEGFLMGMLLAVNLVTFFATLIIAPILYDVAPQSTQVMIMMEIMFFIVSAGIFVIVMTSKGRCGIRIYLQKYRQNDYLISKYYQFTDFPERDAEKIKRIVDTLSAIARKRAAFDEAEQLALTKRLDAERAKGEECCTRYREVIQKVKPE
jgi:hypothetical protein